MLAATISFFIAAAIDPARNRGPVKEALAAAQAELLDFVAEEIATAQSLGEVPEGVAPRELAFGVDAFLTGADLNFLLFDDPGYLELAKDAIRRLLGQPSQSPTRTSRPGPTRSTRAGS